MALITCPECGKEVSDTCTNCIHCGYLLHSPSSPLPQNDTQRFSFSEAPKKRHKLVIILAAVVALVSMVISCLISGDFFSSGYSPNYKHDPFRKLYNAQSRESVLKAYGTPKRSQFHDPDIEYSWNVDTYYKVRFLTECGELSVWYDDNNLVTHAWFEYYYEDYDPSSDDRYEVIEYALDIIDFYTEKYGEPESGYYDYEWSLPDGSEIGLRYDLYPNDTESVIVIYWS